MNSQEPYTERSERVLMHTYSRIPAVFSRGEGVYLYGADGSRYLDFLAGIAVNALGYGHPALRDALKRQGEKLWHISNLFQIPEQVRLAEKLVAHSDFSKVFFCNSGTEANEAALKLARKHGRLNGGSSKIIAARQSFHGRTVGSLSVTGQTKYQKSFTPLMGDVGFVPFNDESALEETVNEETCAVILEPLQGEGGIHPARRSFLQTARRLCDRYHALLIFDEVQCGLGRTGALFAYSHSGVKPDAVTLAKGLGGGFPIGALLATDEAAVFEPGDHAATFGGNPLASAVSLALLSELIDNGVVEHAGQVGGYLIEKLNRLASASPRVKEVRGMGLMLGLELTSPAGPVMDACRERGLIVGKAGDRVIRLVPPLIISREDVDTAVGILGEALEAG